VVAINAGGSSAPEPSNSIGVVPPVSPTLSAFNIPTQISLGTPPFQITAPTSDSAGAFSYSSSNTFVATMSGNTITLLHPGNTIITATQAADGNFTSGTIAAPQLLIYA
jgi:hypothetical protein